MNNAVYCKMMENLRNIFDIKLVITKKTILNVHQNQAICHMSHKVFNNNLVAIRKSKVSLKLNKPAYIGMCILELSKVLMYQFHYDYNKNKYDNKSKLLFIDTDSLIYEMCNV